MNKKFRITGIAINNTIDLTLFAKGIGIKGFENWKKCLEIDKNIISSLLKYTVEEGEIFLYKLGAIVIIGLDEREERDILCKLELFLQIEYIIQVPHLKEFGYCNSRDFHIKAEAMAKSIRLKYIELEVDQLIEEAEPFLIKISKGSKRGFTPKFCRIIAKVQRMEIESIEVLAVLGRSYQGLSKEIYEELIETYAIKERFTIVNEKLRLLTGITDTHELFGRFIGWNRLLIIEIVLLFSFPLPTLMSFDIIGLWHSVYSLLGPFLKGA